MSPVQEPFCTAEYPRTRIDAALIRAEFLHPDSFHPSTFLDEEDTAMRRRAESVSQYKLPTYQAAAVVVRTVYSESLILHVILIEAFSSPRSPLSLPE